MTVLDFYNKQFNVEFTRNELSGIYDAIFIAIREYEKLGYKATTRELNDIFEKFTKILSEIDKE